MDAEKVYETRRKFPKLCLHFRLIVQDTHSEVEILNHLEKHRIKKYDIRN